MRRYIHHILALLLALPVLAADSSSLLVPAAQRPALPRFTPLEGFAAGETLSPDDLKGHVAVINIWYEY